jgi:protein phosphatase
MLDLQANFETGVATDVGCVRKLNEDAYVVRPERGLWCVADGMGGHDGGEIASAIVVDALARTLVARTLGDLMNNCAALIGEANRRIYAIAEAKGATIGTTVAILIAQGREFACIWAGDSRVYQVRDGRIRQVTRDHTEAQDLVDQGVLSAEEARRWPRRNVITRAVGVQSEAELELRRGDLAPQDVFVLCSDGLTGHVSDEEILRAALSYSPAHAAQALVSLTLSRGALDNVTVVVVRCARRSAPMVAPENWRREATAPDAGNREKTLPPVAAASRADPRAREAEPGATRDDGVWS